MIRGNADMLGILLRNLVDNAIRYTPRQGRVSVSLLLGQGRVRLEVQDSGPGIPEQERQRVFDRFYRILGNDAAGSGLGLSIVKRSGFSPAAFVVFSILAYREAETSAYQARYLSRLAGELRYEVKKGPNASLLIRQAGPYDVRLGYSRLPAMITRLEQKVSRSARRRGCRRACRN